MEGTYQMWPSKADAEPQTAPEHVGPDMRYLYTISAELGEDETEDPFAAVNAKEAPAG